MSEAIIVPIYHNGSAIDKYMDKYQIVGYALTDLPQGSPGVGRNTFLSSPHLCFIIVFICDLFVSRDDPLMC